MSTTYSTSLRLALMGTGDQSGTWGNTTNTNLGTLLEQSISGVRPISLTGLTTYTLQAYNGTTDDARSMVLVFTGSPSATVTIVAPLVNKIYIVVNLCGQTINMTATGGSTSLAIPYSSPGLTAQCYCDAANATGLGAGFYSSQTGSAGNFVVNGTLSATGESDTGNLSVGGNLSVTGTTSLTGAISGAGISSYLASPPAIGGTAPAAGTFTTLGATGNFAAVGNVTAGGSVVDSLGNVRIVPIEAKSTAYTLLATDSGQCISITTGGITVPASVLAAGNAVTIYNNSSSSQTITQGSGLTLQFAGQYASTTGNRTLSQYGVATVLFISPTVAFITGAGLS